MNEGWRKEIGNFFFLFLLSLLLIVFDQRGWLKLPKNLIQKPILAIEEGMLGAYQELSAGVRGLDQAGREAEIQRLDGLLRQLSVDQNQLSLCQEENAKMRSLLGANLPKQWRFLPAKVIGLAGEIVIDKGRADGIKEEATVLVDNVLVGKINWVGESTARASRFDDQGVKISVLVKRPNQAGVQARGLLLGQGGSLLLDRVIQSEQIQTGDLITSNDDGELPIGQISEVLPKTAEVYQQAKVRPLVDYQQLRIVFVVL